MQNLTYKALVVGAGEKVDFQTLDVLTKPRSESLTQVKAVVFPGGELNLRGMIRIEKGANLSEAFLKQNILLLGGDAKATAIPELEIETDEVKASHAAAVGQVDEEQMFYLMSRGLSRGEAKKLIVEAFLEEILDKINKDEVKEIRNKLNRWTI